MDVVRDMTRDIILCCKLTDRETKIRKKIRRSFSDTRLFTVKYGSVNESKKTIAIIYGRRVTILYEEIDFTTYEKMWIYRMDRPGIGYQFPENLEISEYSNRLSEYEIIYNRIHGQN